MIKRNAVLAAAAGGVLAIVGFIVMSNRPQPLPSDLDFLFEFDANPSVLMGYQGSGPTRLISKPADLTSNITWNSGYREWRFTVWKPLGEVNGILKREFGRSGWQRVFRSTDPVDVFQKSFSNPDGTIEVVTANPGGAVTTVRVTNSRDKPDAVRLWFRNLTD